MYVVFENDAWKKYHNSAYVDSSGSVHRPKSSDRNDSNQDPNGPSLPRGNQSQGGNGDGGGGGGGEGSVTKASGGDDVPKLSMWWYGDESECYSYKAAQGMKIWELPKNASENNKYAVTVMSQLGSIYRTPNDFLTKWGGEALNPCFIARL